MKLVKPTSNYALGKIQAANKRLKYWGLRGLVLLLVAAPLGLAVGLLDSFSGSIAGLALGTTGAQPSAGWFLFLERGFEHKKGLGGRAEGGDGIGVP